MINFFIKVSIWIFVAPAVAPGAAAAVEDSVMVARVLGYYEAAAPERMVINTDRDECRPGGRVSFRACVVSAADNFDSQLSNFICLDLYRNNGWQRVSHSKYIRNENGSFSNNITIPDWLEPGEYTIVGYTRHMLGFPPETLVYKPLTITDTDKKKETPHSLGIELAPEGGHYVEGTLQKVGVRLTGADGPTGVYHVEVCDSAGHAVYDTDTDPWGYATVRLRNDSLNPLRVTAVGADSLMLSTEVPRAERDCAALRVTHGDSLMKIGILTHGDIDLSALNVVVRASGMVFSMAADKAAQVRIPLATLPAGPIDIDLVDDSRRRVLSTRRIHNAASPAVSLTPAP